MTTPLSTYMKRERVTDAAFAAAIGKDRSLVTRLRNGTVRPTIDVAGAIERETRGAVPMQAWIGSERTQVAA
jgi:transcriptional regulator with XRE-family HTH domain